jgi:hypothetical protein
MRTRRSTTITQLRSTIDCLPRDTKVAMLEGMRTNEIIVGAYTDDEGICPMLAAHRAGGRTNFISFAKAWDRFAFRDVRHHRARRATERELLVLRSHLEASLLEDDGPVADFGAAISEHRGLMERRHAASDEEAQAKPSAGKAPANPRPGDRDRSRELGRRPGWSWLRVMRRYDEYEQALALLQAETGDAPPARADGAHAAV